MGIKWSALGAAGTITGAEITAVNQGGVTLQTTTGAIGVSIRTVAEIAASVTPVNYQYAPGHVKRFAIVDGVTDDTAALNNWLKVGGDLRADFAGTALITGQLLFVSNTTLRANPAFIIQQKAATNLNGIMLYGNAVSNVTVEALTVDGNAANNATGLTYGIEFNGGSNNKTVKCYVHDTTQEGISFWMESGSGDEGSTITNPGRNIGTDNHGLAFISNTSTPIAKCYARGTIVTNAYRKGIAGYALTPGYIDGLEITNCSVNGCGLGGIYVANGGSTTTPMVGVVITGNRSYGNYNNYLVQAHDSLVMNDNAGWGDTGGGNFICLDLVGGTVNSNQSLNSQVAGIRFGSGYIANCLSVTCNGNNVLNSNQSSAGYGPGIDLTNIQYSAITGNTCDDRTGTPKQTYAISESGTSDYNTIEANALANATSALLHITGAHTVYQLQGSTATAQALVNTSTITNGGYEILRVTAAAAVTGVILTPGTYAGQTCTVVNESAAADTVTMAASASNVADGSSCVIAGLTQKTFVWDAATSLWYHS